ncbi:hypothetical protein ISS37_02070 [candidate division KSB1 bacterium]|nr:hypothetical protein [candidate division KSB1 bacterium]
MRGFCRQHICLSILISSLFFNYAGGQVKFEVIQQLFPNSLVSWEKEFDGKIRDVQVGGENILVFSYKRPLTTPSYITKVSYLDFNGNVLWEQSKVMKHDKEDRIINISLSRDGKSFIINSAEPYGEILVSRSYDKDGNLKWKASVRDPGLTISPLGNYAITTQQSGEEITGFFHLFDNRSGEEIYRDPEASSWFATFLNDSEIAYIKTKEKFNTEKNRFEIAYTRLILFDAKKCQSKWEVDINDVIENPHPLWVSEACPRIKASNDGRFIALGVKNFGVHQAYAQTLIMFDNKGNLLWYDEDSVYIDGILCGISSFSFSWDSKYIFVQRPRGGLELLNCRTGEVKWRKIFKRFYGIQNDFSSNHNYIISSKWGRDKKIAILNIETGELQENPDVYSAFGSIVPIWDLQESPTSFIILSKDQTTIQKIDIKP